MNNLDTGNIRHTRHMTKTKINTTQHNTTQRKNNLDTGNIRHTRHRTKTKINTTQHNTENEQCRYWQL
jgi:hypothetical protein